MIPARRYFSAQPAANTKLCAARMPASMRLNIIARPAALLAPIKRLKFLWPKLSLPSNSCLNLLMQI